MERKWGSEDLEWCSEWLDNFDKRQEQCGAGSELPEWNPFNLEKASAVYRQQSLDQSIQLVEELGEDPMLRLTAEESRRQFLEITESIIQRHKTENEGDMTLAIPRSQCAMMVYTELGLVQDIPADEEGARRMVRDLASQEWDRLAGFIVRREAIERITSLAEMS